MKYMDEFRDEDAARPLADAIRREARGEWRLMEVCGGQTHAIIRFGIDELLPENLELIHGPGCPVCVTPVALIDQALTLAARQDTILCAFGDMLRVPGSAKDLLAVRAEGGDVRMVYSPLDAVRIASAEPAKEVVFFAVGFETTAPATAIAVLQARRMGLLNFSLLASHVTAPPAIRALMASEGSRIHAFLAAGHVCAVMGCEEYEPLAREFEVPIVVTGFEPVDILRGVLMCVRQLEAGEFRVENQYARCVRTEGNRSAQRWMREVYEPVDRTWRGIGRIPRSGLGLRAQFERWDAQKKFGLPPDAPDPASECLSGQVLRGWIKPDACPAFGKQCNPERPLGAPMVSSEGACAAYFKYGRTQRLAASAANGTTAQLQ